MKCLINKRSGWLFGLVFTVTGHAGLGLAAPVLTVRSAGDSAFVIQGMQLENVATMDITVTYNSASLANPQVRQGELIAGAMMAVNANTPGTVRLALIRTEPIEGSGTVATLYFSKNGNAAGSVNTLSARLTSTGGEELPVSTQVYNQPVADSSQNTSKGPEQEESRPPDQSDSGTNSSFPGMVGLTVTTDSGGERREHPGKETFDQTAMPAPGADPMEPYREMRTAVSETPFSKVPEREISSMKSVLHLFREYRGSRSAKAFIALFEASKTEGFRQIPSIVAADGKTTVTVVFRAEPGKQDPPNMAVSGARLISVVRDPQDYDLWSAKLLPERGEDGISVAVTLGKLSVFFPLTVVPRLNVDLDESGKITQADFSLFLNSQGGFDLNGDGKRDYKDDYLFTANYLLARPPHSP